MIEAACLRALELIMINDRLIESNTLTHRKRLRIVLYMSETKRKEIIERGSGIAGLIARHNGRSSLRARFSIFWRSIGRKIGGAL